MWREIIRALGQLFNKCRLKCHSSCCDIEMDIKNGSTSDLKIDEETQTEKSAKISTI